MTGNLGLGLIQRRAEIADAQFSCHMALLRESGLVIDRREGKWVHYRLSPNMPAWAAAVIDTSWNCLREETRMKLKNRLPGSC
mgnify:CR=1 FL=1